MNDVSCGGLERHVPPVVPMTTPTRAVYRLDSFRDDDDKRCSDQDTSSKSGDKAQLFLRERKG
jgi:hypothetical protein